MGYLSRSTNWFIKTVFIHIFKRIYKVDLNQAARTSVREYRSFEDFFTRELAPDSRPIFPDRSAIVSPVDGEVAQIGVIREGTLIQAKGLTYSISALVRESVGFLEGGHYLVIYLAPKDYHRIHAPADLSLESCRTIPGTRFPVNQQAVLTVPDLFTRNIRLACKCSTNGINHYAIYVGALIVAGIKTQFEDGSTPYKKETSASFENSVFQKGEEMARFVLGSTVILAIPKELGRFAGILPGQTLRLGQKIGSLNTGAETA